MPYEVEIPMANHLGGPN